MVTEQLICAFIFAYAKIRFSHDVVQLKQEIENCGKSVGGRVLHPTNS